MQPLDRTLRGKLERTVKEARTIAERAAQTALAQLGVREGKPFAYLTPDQRELRRRLRSHGRQLGDERNALTETQSIDRLLEEVAYQHWHRMFFARCLAENELLMYPDPVAPVAVTLAECADLAAEEGSGDAWAVAARFAAHMLPQIFRPTSPVFQLTLPPEDQQALERLLENLERDVFSAADGLGWVYQFWQSKRKEEVNAAEVKIGARELPAVTQLFTEPYMVSFLLDNALGAWWVGQRCGMGRRGERETELAEVREIGLTAAERAARAMLHNAQNEQEVRNYFALPGFPLTYLRFVCAPADPTPIAQSPNPQSPPLPLPPWCPAAGWFTDWPATLAELKVLDPCCGSGHFLVAVFGMLVAMRMEGEELSARDAVDAVLRQNLHGLEIDPRCVEIAAFALALTAWRYPDAGGYRPLPELNLACSGLAVSAKKAEWLALAHKAADEIVASEAPTLFPDPAKESLWHAQLKSGMETLYDLFQDAPILGSLINPNRDEANFNFLRADYDQVAELLVQALADDKSANEDFEMGVVAQGMAHAATLLAGRYNWVVTNVPYLARGKQGKTLRDFCEDNYADAKNDLATVFLERCLEFCHLHGTASIVLPQNWLFLTSYKKLREKLLKADTWPLLARLGEGGFDSSAAAGAFIALITLSRGKASATHLLRGLDVSAPRTAGEKASQLLTGEIAQVVQVKQLENPDARVALEQKRSELGLLIDLTDSYEGIGTGDLVRFQIFWWESILDGEIVVPFKTTTEITTIHSGCTGALLWERGKGDMITKAREQDSRPTRGYRAWGKIGVAINRMRDLAASLYYGEKFDCNIAAIIPKDPRHLPAIWNFCSSKEYQALVREIDQALKVTNHTLVKVPFDLDHWTQIAAERYPHGLPAPFSDDPTQWIFHGHPCGSVVWDESTKRLAHGSLRTDETVLQVAVARMLGYRWPAELDPKMELADEARTWVARSAALLPLADKDGIVCLAPVRGELAAAERLLNLLAVAYGDAWRADTLATLLAASGWAGKSLESWLRDAFFSQHGKLFQQRPFVWHIWDGQPDGFAALVNYHKFDAKLLGTLIYTYLGDWITRQKGDLANGVDGAGIRLAAAETLKKRLELILAGEAPYDIFVRWKPLSEQPIGWNPDLNDGVRLNIRPFLRVADVAKKGAGVLRDRPNIKWEKDRGKDVESAPWYQHFGGDRINDHHLSLAEKQTARKAVR